MKVPPASCGLLVLALIAPLDARAESLTLVQVLARVIERDASLEVAGRRVERARQEIARVESQLGWVASGQAGVARDVSQFGTPVDRSDATARLDRPLASGGQFGIGAGFTHEDSATTFSPLQPNPSDSTRLDLSYRMPLARGAGNPGYHEGLTIAQAGTQATDADRGTTRDALARRAAEVFYSAAFTHARLKNAEAAIARAERFRQYIVANMRLGIAEEKDRLQAEAQLAARLAEQRTLSVAWTQQRTTLNRLMERPWGAEFEPNIVAAAEAPARALEQMQALAETSSADLKRERARLAQAEAAIAQRRDAARDQFDLVLSAGRRTLEGDVAGGSVDQSESVGGVRLEYRASLDRRGSEAELTQAQIDRSIALRNISALQDDVRYAVAGLADEIEIAERALERQQAHLASEQAKLDEANARYRRGRADTAQIIEFERDMRSAELLVDQQTIELARRRTELAIRLGELWEHVTPGGAAQGERP